EIFIEVLPLPVVGIAEDTIICLGESVQLNFASDNMSAYTWTSDDPNFTDINNPEPVVTPAQTSTYTLSASNGICNDIEASVLVEVIGSVSLDIVGPTGLVCSGDEISLVANVTGGSSEDSFNWTVENGTDTFTGDSIIVAPEETTTYVLNYTSAGGCETITDSYTVTVEEGVDITGIEVSNLDGSDDQFLLGHNIQLTAIYNTAITEGLTFSWYLDTTLITSGVGLATIETQILQDGNLNYSVVIETPTGCSETLNTIINVLLPMFGVPNIFTPNGDEMNDFFNITPEESMPLLEVMEFKVYNRWGQLVYDNDTPDTGWDGTFNGKPQPIEVYFYSIKIAYLGGESAGEFQGNVTLAR
ncbi:MAG: gliding motility-associated C-terminal domain-containing protein, partial [Chitinophagales bacterium]|nr:gliding motility-associated C-terminal domain-containing protein [Chitinophagales bacterium]